MRLLKKTIVPYFVFSAILLLAAIPVFYFALKKLMINNVDEELLAAKTRIIPQLRSMMAGHNEGDLVLSNYDVFFEKQLPNKKGDSIYNIAPANSITSQITQSRLLTSHFYINQEFYSLRIKTSIVDKLSLIKRIVFLLAILLIALFLGLLAINRLLTKEIWRPFYATLKRLQDYRVDRQPVLKLNHSSVNEFNDLNKAIEQLTERNYQVYASQKEFAENASHEMQSPLAVFQSKLELLMQTKPLSEDQAALITDLADASKRMSRLNKSLILLTRIDNNQFLERESLSINDVLQKLIRQYEFQTEQQSIRVVTEEITDVSVEANKTLLEMLIGNLLSNAIRHNIPNGRIEIMLKDKELVMKNSGRPAPLDIQRLFQRFQKNSTDTDSIGLGLEIVKKICDMNHYTIEYRFTGQMHQFSVRF